MKIQLNFKELIFNINFQLNKNIIIIIIIIIYNNYNII